jgi:hypothetical protein
MKRRCGRYHTGWHIELPVRQRSVFGRQGQPSEGRPFIAAERIWLRRPIKVAQRSSEAVVVVLRSLVILEDDFFAGTMIVRPVYLSRITRRCMWRRRADING